MANWGIGKWIGGPERLVGPEPALKDAVEEKQRKVEDERGTRP